MFTTPTKATNITEELLQYQSNTGDIEIIFPDATTATWDDTTITITNSPEIGAVYDYTFSAFGMEYNIEFTIINITDDKINISQSYEEYNETTYMEINRTVTFNRSFTITRFIKIPRIFEFFISEDIQRAGYSLDPLAGETLIFEVNIIKVQRES